MKMTHLRNFFIVPLFLMSLVTTALGVEPVSKPAVEAKTFTLGSSRDEVLAAQGTPSRILSARPWWYRGLSRVEFGSNGRVTGWNNTGDLHVELLPSGAGTKTAPSKSLRLDEAHAAVLLVEARRLYTIAKAVEERDYATATVSANAALAKKLGQLKKYSHTTVYREALRQSSTAAPTSPRTLRAKSTVTETNSRKECTVYVTKTGECYHRGHCSYLRQSKLSISLSTARQSYRACSRCSPPVVASPAVKRSSTTAPVKSKPFVAENGSTYGAISPATGKPKTTHVNGYFRKDGTYVRGHYRSK